MHPAFGGAGGANGFGGFINDPTAQMGLQMGQGALKVGQEYMEQNVSGVHPLMLGISGWHCEARSGVGIVLWMCKGYDGHEARKSNTNLDNSLL